MRGMGRRRMRAAAVLVLALASGCGGNKPAAKPVPAVKLTAENYEAEVKAVRGTPVLVHFWSASCYHCKAVRRMLEQLNGDYAGRLKIAELEIGSARSITAPLKVRNAPTLLFYRDGEEVGRLEGGPNREAIEPMVERVLAGQPAGDPAAGRAGFSDPAAGVTDPVVEGADDPEDDPDVIDVMQGSDGSDSAEDESGEDGNGGADARAKAGR